MTWAGSVPAHNMKWEFIDDQTDEVVKTVENTTRPFSEAPPNWVVTDFEINFDDSVKPPKIRQIYKGPSNSN